MDGFLLDYEMENHDVNTPLEVLAATMLDVKSQQSLWMVMSVAQVPQGLSLVGKAVDTGPKLPIVQEHQKPSVQSPSRGKAQAAAAAPKVAQSDVPGVLKVPGVPVPAGLPLEVFRYLQAFLLAHTKEVDDLQAAHTAQLMELEEQHAKQMGSQREQMKSQWEQHAKQMKSQREQHAKEMESQREQHKKQMLQRHELYVAQVESLQRNFTAMIELAQGIGSQAVGTQQDKGSSGPKSQ
eukprot:m51a1_g8558 hypothetical protein (238) ;mRNA; f:160015-165216